MYTTAIQLAIIVYCVSLLHINCINSHSYAYAAIANYSVVMNIALKTIILAPVMHSVTNNA